MGMAGINQILTVNASLSTLNGRRLFGLSMSTSSSDSFLTSTMLSLPINKGLLIPSITSHRVVNPAITSMDDELGASDVLGVVMEPVGVIDEYTLGVDDDDEDTEEETYIVLSVSEDIVDVVLIGLDIDSGVETERVDSIADETPGVVDDDSVIEDVSETVLKLTDDVELPRLETVPGVEAELVSVNEETLEVVDDDSATVGVAVPMLCDTEDEYPGVELVPGVDG